MYDVTHVMSPCCTCIADLTVDNVRKVLHGIPWRMVGDMLLIPDSKLREIEGEYRSDEEREVAVIRYWILRDPFASWRRIIERLEWKDKDDHAITLYHYSEELTGMLGALTRVAYRGGGVHWDLPPPPPPPPPQNSIIMYIISPVPIYFSVVMR